MSLAWKTNLAWHNRLAVAGVAWADRHTEVGTLILDGSVPSAGVLEQNQRDDRGTGRVHMGGVGVVNNTNNGRLVYTESQRDADVRESMNLRHMSILST